MPRSSQAGSSAVEFALVAAIFFTVFMAIIEFGRWMTTLEMVSNATRTGARMAVVCNMNATQIKARVESLVPQLSLSDAQVSVSYLPSGCTVDTCLTATVGVSGATFTPAIPLLSAAFPIPPFASTLPRESMQSVNADGDTNPVCNCGAAGGPACL